VLRGLLDEMRTVEADTSLRMAEAAAYRRGLDGTVAFYAAIQLDMPGRPERVVDAIRSTAAGRG